VLSILIDHSLSLSLSLSRSRSLSLYLALGNPALLERISHVLLETRRMFRKFANIDPPKSEYPDTTILPALAGDRYDTTRCC
jgi:hypothetical protein